MPITHRHGNACNGFLSVFLSCYCLACSSQLRSIAHAALDAPISSIPLESNKTRGEVSKATQPPLESREASVASEACQEITPVPLGPTVEEERVAISDLKPNTTSTGTAENNDPAENRSMDRDIVSNGQSTEIDLPSTAIDTIEERLQTCSGADGAIELTKKVMVEKDLARLPQESRRQESGDGGTSPPAAERTNRQAAAELDSPAKATDLVKDEEEAVGATRAGGQNETDDLSQSMATFDDDERTDSDGSVYTSGTPASLESAAEIDASQSPDSGSLIRSSIGGCDGSVATSSVEGTVVDCARSESAQASPVSVQSRVVADNLNPASALVVSTELTSLHGSVNGARGKSTHASPVLVESRVVADYLNGASSTLVLTELARLRGGDDCARHKFAQGPPVSIESRVVADYLANASHSMVIAGLVDLHTSTHSSTPEHARTPTVEREDTPTPAAGLAKPSECSLVAASTVSAQDRDDAQATQAQERNNASIASKAIHRDSVEVPALENTFQQIFNHPITENTDADAAARDDQSANPEVLAAPCFEDASSSSRAVALLGEDCGAAVPDLIAAESLVSTAPEVLGTLADEGGAGLNKDFADGTHVQGAPGLPLSVEARALVDDIILSSVTTVAAVVAADARDKRCTRKILGSNDLRKGSNAPLLGTPPLDNTRKTNAKPVLPVEQLKPTSRPEVFLAPRVENAVGSSNTLLAKQHESPTTSFVAQVNHLESSAVACVVVEGGVVAKSANGGVGRVQFEFPPDSSVAATTDVAADYVDHTMREALTAVSQVLGASDTPKDATGTHLTMGQAFLRQAVQDPTAPATPAFEPSGTLPTTTIGAENGLTLVRAGEMRGTETDIVEEQRRGDIVDGRNPPSALCLEAFVVGDYLAVAYGTIAMLEVPTLIENKPMGLDEHKPMGLDEHGGPEGQRRSSPLLPKDDLVISPAALPLESRDVQDIIPCAPAPTANMAVSRPTPPEKESALTCASLMPSSVDERYCDSTHRDDLIGADVQSSNYVSASHQSETEEIRVSRDTPDGPSCATLQNAVVADYMSDAVRSLLVAEMNTTWSSLRTCQGIAALNVCENQTITSPFLQYPVANPTRESTDGRSKPNTDQDSDPVSETHVLSSAEAITPKLRVNEEEQYFGIAPHDLGRAQVQNRDGQNGVEEQSKSVCPLAAPIPPGTRREETHDNIDAQRQPESKQNPVDRRHPHPPVEALPWSQENGGGAKMRDNSDVGNATWALENLGQENTTGSYLEAGEWLREVGVWTKSLEDGMMRAHADAISWLQEAGRRAKAVQDEAVKARADAASWLREAGGQAKSLQATVAGAHSEAAAWLQGVGARAMFLQEKTDGVRLDAVAWLTTRGAMELDREKISERSAVASERQTNGTDVHLHAKAESINLNNFNQPTKDCSIQVKGSTQDDDKEGFAARRSRQENEPSAVAITEYCEVAGNSKEAVLANSDKETIIPYSAGVYTTDDGSAYTCAPPSQTTDSAALSENCAKPPADSLTLVERTAPDTWLEPATAPLGREGSAAPTESGAGQMLNAGETEWSRVSLSRTPPFDALNSPSLALRWAPAGARPRPLAADLECIKDTVASADTANKSPDSGAAATAAVNGRAVLSPNAGGLGWMDFFAPPHRMAPIGDAYGIDSFRSAEASASTTIRGDSTGSFMPSHASNGTDDGRARRQSYNQTWRWSDGSEESWGLGEVQNPASEAKCRMRDQLGVCLEESGGGWGGAAEKTENSLLSARRICGKYRSKRWDKAAERSRQYIRRWETFLTRVHRHFDSEVSYFFSFLKLVRGLWTSSFDCFRVHEDLRNLS